MRRRQGRRDRGTANAMWKLVLYAVMAAVALGAIFGTGDPYVVGVVIVLCLGIGAWIERGY
jgi:hypothetical protein